MAKRSARTRARVARRGLARRQAAAQAAGAGARRPGPPELAGVLTLSLLVAGLFAPPAGAQVLPRNAVVVQGALPPQVSGAQMVIPQTQSRAIINWESFSIGRGASVRFDQQGQRDWAVLNRVVGNERSLIEGVLQADGSVYLINRNGIVFGQGAVVDVGSFVASTMNVSDKVFRDGLLSLPVEKPAFSTEEHPDYLPRAGIRIEPDAVIQAASGGQVFFIASGTLYDADGNALPGRATIENNGTLRAPDGQVILAAGDKVFLRTPNSNLNRREAGFVGLAVQADDGGQVANAVQGLIEARRGNVTLAATVVNQMGRVSATTSVDRDGSVWLLASKPRAGSGDTALIEFGAASVTQVVPDAETAARTAPDAQFRDAGGSLRTPASTIIAEAWQSSDAEIRLRGADGGGPGAILRAPGGRIALSATAGNPQEDPPLAGDGSRILLERGVRIDASGLRAAPEEDGTPRDGDGVPVALERDSVRIELQGEQLADAPLLRDSPIRGKAVLVDARLGSAAAGLINADALRDALDAGVQRGIHERLTAGGSVTLNSGGDLIVQPDAQILVKGGAIRHQAGQVDTSRLFDGRRYYPIESAPSDLRYTSVATTAGRREEAYTEGRDGGTVTIGARNLAFNGQVVGGAIAGPRQRRSPPGGGTLLITENTDSKALALADDHGLRHGLLLDRSAPLEIVLRAGETPAQARERIFGSDDAPLDQPLSLDMLEASGLSDIRIRTNGAITVASGRTIGFAPDTRFELTGERIDFNAGLRSAGGQLSLTATGTVHDGGPSRPDAPWDDHPVRIGAGVSLDLSGEWINDRARPVSGERSDPVAGIMPGRVAISSPTGIEFGQGSSISVDSGAWIDPAGRLLAGDALLAETGNRSGDTSALISLKVSAGDDRSPATGALVPNSRFPVADTRLQLPARMSGYGFDNGARLALAAARVDIGDGVPAAPNGIALTPAFFRAGGFSGYEIDGVHGLEVHDGAQLVVRQRNFQLAAPPRLLDGEALAAQVSVVERFDTERRASHLALSATAVDDGVVSIGAGARIDADARARVALEAGYRVEHRGSIVAPGGTVTMSAGRDFAGRGFRPDLGVQLYDGSSIDVGGTAMVTTDRLGLRAGEVLAGGRVELSADPGTVVFERGARIGVAGAQAGLDLGDGSGRRAARQIGSDAGSVIVTARLGALLAGTIDGRPGGPGQAGARVAMRFGAEDTPMMVDRGSITYLIKSVGLSLDDGFLNGLVYGYYPYGERRFVLGTLADAPAVEGGARADLDASFNGARPLRFDDPAWASRPTHFWVAAETLAGAADIAFSGADVLALPAHGALSAAGSIVLDVPALRMNGGSFALSAPHLQLGRIEYNEYGHSAAAAATLDGRLQALAGHTLDLRGDLWLTGIAQAVLGAGESLRFTGMLRPRLSSGAAQPPEAVLRSSGDLLLRASRAYPTTMSRYRIESDGTVRFEGDGGVGVGRYGLPLSAYGQLAVLADRIEQSGVLLAPFGQISLTARTALELGAGSLTSVSGKGLLVPVGELSNERDLLYALGGSFGSLLLQAPAKAITLEAPVIVSDAAATIDASGGGDIVAHEFVRGPQGLTDFLAPVRDAGGRIVSETFAILPGFADPTRPIDIGAEGNTTLGVGQAVYLSGIDGLPAGTYTLLPARYALLPGAFAVRVTGRRDATSFDNQVLRDGVRLVSGRLVNPGAGTAEARTRLFEVFDGSQLRERAEYVESTGSALFAAEAARLGLARPELTIDGGTIALSAITRLDLDARIDLSADEEAGDGTSGGQGEAGARRGVISLAADRLEIVRDGQAGSDPAALAISVDRLSQIDAGEVSLGGRIISDPVLGTHQLTVGSDSVRIADGVSLQAQSVTVAARERIEVGGGAVLASTLPAGGTVPGRTVSTSGEGALLRVGGDRIDLRRTLGGAPTGGDLVVADGARIAGPAVILDATRRLDVAPGAQLAIGDSLALGSAAMHLGSAAATPANQADGLVLDAARLAQLSALKDLTLNAYRSIAVHGQAALGGAGLQRLTVQAPAIDAAAGGAMLDLSAGSIEWRSPVSGAGGAPAAVVAGTTMTLHGLGGTDRAPVVIGEGAKTAGGFEKVIIDAAPGGDIVFDARRDPAAGGDAVDTLRVAGDLGLNADRLAVASLAQHSVEAGGALQARAVSGADAGPADLNAGGSLALTGASALIDTAVVARSGEITVAASRDTVTLGSNARLVAAGHERTVHDETLRLDGGRIRIAAAGAGDAAAPAIRVAGGAVIDVSAPSATAGELELSATAGAIDLAPDAVLDGRGSARGQGGQLRIDAGKPVVMDQVVAASQGGFDREIDVRVRDGALHLAAGQALSAQTVRLAADDGDLRIDGHIDARAAQGGRVMLAHGGQGSLTLGATALVDARATSAGKGRVELHGNDAAIVFEHGSEVRASGPNALDDADRGELLIRAERDASERIAVQGSGGGGLTVDAPTRVDVDAYRVYQLGAGTGQIAATGAQTATRLTLQALRTDAEQFHANHTAAVAAALPVQAQGGAPADVSVKPGIEVRGASAADVAVIQDLDFSTIDTGTGDARSGGYFTVRSEGNLRLQGGSTSAANPTAVLSDGGRLVGSSFQYSGGESWSYRLVAGADLGAANPVATLDGRGDFILDPNKRVYTGTGSIEIAAGRDVRIGNPDSSSSNRLAASIYTFGQAAEALPGFTPAANINQGGFAAYGRNGGDVWVEAGRDLIGSTIGQYASDWLFRQGSLEGAPPTQDVGWWSRPDLFRMNLGALAGGRVEARAGRDVVKLTAATAGSGRLAGERRPENLVEEGGGPLTVEAGRNVAGGHFIAQRDDVTIRAGDSVTAALGPDHITELAPVIGLGSGSATVTARRDLAFGRSYNTTLLPRVSANNARPEMMSLFSTWSPDSGVSLAAGGSVEWRNEWQLFNLTTGYIASSRAIDIDLLQAPGMRIQAASGDILVGGTRVTLGPSSQGGLTLLAGGDILGAGAGTTIILPGGEIAALGGPDRPFGRTTAAKALTSPWARPDPSFDATRRPVRIYSAGGDVGSADVPSFQLQSSRPVQVRAARDVINFGVTAQNLQASDESRIEAGRDVRYAVSRLPSGDFDLTAAGIGLGIGGPGALVVRAGRHIDLGVSAGVESYGNLKNGDLPRGGAALVLIAGLQHDPDYAAVLDAYVKPSPDGTSPYAQALIDYVRRLTGDTTIADAEAAWARLGTLPAPQREAFAREVFYRELRAGGGPDTAGLIGRFLAPGPGQPAGGALAAELIDFVNRHRPAGSAPVADAGAAWAAFAAMPAVRHAEFTGQTLVPALLRTGKLSSDDPMFRDYARGYRAIATMFPADGAGNIELQFSKVRATQGGAVQIMAPGSVCRDAAGHCTTEAAKAAADPSVGKVLAGVPNPPPALSKAPGELGIFGMGGAPVQILAGSDVTVYGNRIVTLGGGPLLGWSSFGNIDAGRGSRAAVAAPPPTITLDSSGNVQVELGGAVQGSGIRAVATGEGDDELAGEVTLYAPQGFIDAGDAGIQGGAVFVAAAQILNAENIRIGDGITQAVALGDLGAGANLGSIGASAGAAAGSAAQQAAQQAAENASNRASRRNRIIVVEFVGFGPGGAGPEEEERRGSARQ